MLWTPYSFEIRVFFEFYHTLMSYNYSKQTYISGKISLQKIDLGEDYTQKDQENFKKLSTSDTIGGPLHMSHPVFRSLWQIYHVDLISAPLGFWRQIL